VSGWGSLGEILGGGVDTSQAYETGRLRTAQTEDALMAARNKQLENMAAEFKAKNQAGFEDARVAMGVPAAQAHMEATIVNGNLGSNFAATQSGMQTGLENTALQTLGNPNASLGDQFSAGQVAEHKFVPRVQWNGNVGTDVTQYQPGTAPVTYPNQVAQAQIGSDNALAYSRMHPELSPSGADNAGLDPYHGVFGKPNPGEMANQNFNPSLPASRDNLPFVMRPEDPAASAAPIGSRERGMLASVTHGVIEGTQHLGVIMNQPAGADTGLFGSNVFGTHGVGLLQASSNNLRQSLGSTEVKQYNTLMGGQARNAAFIENFGRVPTDGQIASVMSQITFMPGDSTDIEAKMMKAASYRNVIENGVRTFMAIYGKNPDTPPDLIQLMQEADANVKKIVPYTMDDVNALSTNPGQSLIEVTKKRMLNKPVGGAVVLHTPSPVPPNPGTVEKPGAAFPSTNARGWRKMKDAGGNYAYVGPNGEVEEIQ
jgi:hypothetical protein